MKQTKKQNKIWFFVAFIAVILAVPNNTFLKFSLHEIGPLWVSLLRFLILAIALLPVIYIGRKGITSKGFKYSAVAGIAYAAAIMATTGAVFFSQASYPSVIGISSPIIMMFFSAFLTRERISHKSFFGVTLAAVGGFLIIFLPVLLSGGMGAAVSPVATILAFIAAVASPFMYIMTKKSIDAGMKAWTSMGIIAWSGLPLVGIILLCLNIPAPSVEAVINPGVIIPIVYAVIAVMFLSRAMTALAIKHLGSAPVAGLDYLGVFLSVAVPVVTLGEKLSVEMMLGGGLILAGVIAIELKYTPKWLRKRKSYISSPSHSTID